MKKLLLFASLFITVFAQAQIHPVYQQLFQHTLDSVCEKNKIKGISAAVLIPGGGTWTGVYGESHAGTPITKDMYLPIGSNTKTFVATVILKMQENGQLNINDTIGTWFPNDSNINGQITIKQLLNHTSGLYDFTGHPGFFAALNADYNKVWQPEDMLDFIDSPVAAPGAKFEYCNTNYLLAGLIIKQIRNESFEVTVRNMILTPLGLNHTTVYPAEQAQTGTIPHGWSITASGGTKQQDLMVTYNFSNIAFLSMAYTAGNILSTAEDNVKFWNGLMSGQIINSSSMAMMKEFVFISSGYQYGLGLMRINPINGRPIYAHGGTCPGFLNENLIDSVNSTCITVLSNQDSINNGLLFSRVVAALHKITVNMPPAAVAGITGTPSDIILYPNPAVNTLNIKTSLRQPAQYGIYDISGRMLLSGELKDKIASISVASLPAGLYMTRIYNAEGVLHTEKLQISK